jgi:hypothetical protein
MYINMYVCISMCICMYAYTYTDIKSAKVVPIMHEMRWRLALYRPNLRLQNIYESKLRSFQSK